MYEFILVSFSVTFLLYINILTFVENILDTLLYTIKSHFFVVAFIIVLPFLKA